MIITFKLQEIKPDDSLSACLKFLIKGADTLLQIYNP